MSDLNTPLLMLGQRAVTEQNGNLFVKMLSSISSNHLLPKWDEPWRTRLAMWRRGHW